MKTGDVAQGTWRRIGEAGVAIVLLGILGVGSEAGASRNSIRDAGGAPAERGQAAARPVAQQVARPAAMREMAPEMEARFAASKGGLQPSAKAWIEQQARIEGQKPAPDVAGIEAAIRARFGNRQAGAGGSHATAGAAPARGAVPVSGAGPASGMVQQAGNLSAADISELVFLVMMQASKDAENDLRQAMGEVKAVTAAKQKLREVLNSAGREVAAAGAANGKAPANAPCNIPTCRALAEGAMQLATMTAQSRHPLRYGASGQLTYAQAQQEMDKMKRDLDSLGDLSEAESLRLQMAMDRRAKAVEILSNLMKKMEATSSAMVQNLK
ncbi:MAG: hypothetical protein LAN84_17045 [Acidobacteriia bacterium]|nr:hypothetical protein [Terriglobia bacterium]